MRGPVRFPVPPGSRTVMRRVGILLGGLLLVTATASLPPSALYPSKASAATVANLLRLNPTSDPAGGACLLGYSSVNGFNQPPAKEHLTIGLQAYAGHAVQVRFSFDRSLQALPETRSG